MFFWGNIGISTYIISVAPLSFPIVNLKTTLRQPKDSPNVAPLSFPIVNLLCPLVDPMTIIIIIALTGDRGWLDK